MCGLIGGQCPAERVEAVLPLIHHRGPDAAAVEQVGPWALGHTRLAIVDLDARANQPMTRGSVVLTFNGEVWNHRTLRDSCPPLVTESDTEVVAWTLAQRPVGEALRDLSGMFALAWSDGTDLYLARDLYGEIPLHVGRDRDGLWLWASELHALLALGAVPGSVRWVEPGTFWRITPDGDATVTSWRDAWAGPADGTPARLRQLLATACEERAMGDVPVACLLSGGVDSSVVAFELAKHVDELVLYTAVHDPKSPDLAAAREVAEVLACPLVEVAVKPPTADDLAAVVSAIEMPHKAQVEIAWACVGLADALAADGVKVVLSGEGSDELWASYGRSHFGIEKDGWYGYRRGTFIGQHRKNFARCNKVFMRRGIECRLPFLHGPLVAEAMSWTRSSVEFPPSWGGRARQKAILGAAYEDVLPERVVRRPKLAFQTGAGLDTAAGAAVASPQRYYRAEFQHQFRGVAA